MNYIKWMIKNGGAVYWAKKLGVTRGNIYQWKSKRCSPTAWMIKRIVVKSNYQITANDICGIKMPEKETHNAK